MRSMALSVTPSKDQAKNLLSDEDQELLADLLESTPASGGGVDSKAFRVKHFKSVPAINSLESKGLIRKDGEKYVVDITVLPHLHTKASETVLASCEQIFEILKAHYFQTQTKPITVNTVARRANRSRRETLTALSYMIHSQCIGGRSTDLAEAKACLYPAEAVLTYQSFREAIEQLSGWHQKHFDATWRMSTQGALMPDPVSIEADAVLRPIYFPSWIDMLPLGLRDLLKEVYRAVALDLRALAAMGIRAAIDLVCVEQVGDVGSFQQKLNSMLMGQHISVTDCDHVLAAIEMGNASAHRGHIPSTEDLQTLLLICERLIAGKYVIPKGSDALRGNTPARKPTR